MCMVVTMSMTLLNMYIIFACEKFICKCMHISCWMVMVITIMVDSMLMRIMSSFFSPNYNILSLIFLTNNFIYN